MYLKYSTYISSCKYPWTKKYCEVLSSHPQILTSEALVDCSPAEFFGMIKDDILPPS